MAISKTKMQMVIDNYFKNECDINTSIRQAFEKGFCIGVKKGVSINRPQGEWRGEWMPILEANEFGEVYQAGIYCSECGETLGCEANFCPNCGAKMKGADDE